MRRRQTTPVLRCIGLVAAACCVIAAGCRSEPTESADPAQAHLPRAGSTPTATAGIALTSSAFEDGHAIPRRYTADGADISPPLAWSDLPEGTRQLALICEDPDAPDPANPRSEPWVHWVVYNIPATAAGLPEAIAPQAVPLHPAGIRQGTNSWPDGQNVGYRGPAPPIGRHRYIFRLFALDEELDLQPGLDKAALLKAMEGRILAEGRLMGTYQR